MLNDILRRLCGKGQVPVTLDQSAAQARHHIDSLLRSLAKEGIVPQLMDEHHCAVSVGVGKDGTIWGMDPTTAIEIHVGRDIHREFYNKQPTVGSVRHAD